MNHHSNKGVITTDTADETNSFNANTMTGVNKENGYREIPVTSEEFARQIKATAEPLIEQLKRFCDLMKAPRQNSLGQTKVAKNSGKGSTRTFSKRFDR